MVISLRNRWLALRHGIDFGAEVQPSLSSRFCSRRRGMISIGDQTLIAFKTLICTYDPQAGRDRPVRIGSRCFIGGGSMILPGVTIGDGVIVGAGSVVAHDLPARSIAVGNPAKVLRSGIAAGPYGRLEIAEENTRRVWGS